MEITLKELLEGKSTKIKNKNYLSTNEYIKPFVDYMSKLTSDFKVEVHLPQQITKSNGTDDITYNKVLIQATLPNIINKKYREVCCLCYGLDIRQPLYKMYRGWIDNDNNLYIFDSTLLTVNEVEPDTKLEYDLKRMLEKQTSFLQIISELDNIKFEFSKNLESLGSWIQQCLISEYATIGGRVKLSTNDVIKVYSSLYIKEDTKEIIETEYTALDVYSEFSKLIRDDKKDILNKFDKTLLIKNILQNIWPTTH